METRIKVVIGELVMANQANLAKIEELEARIKELEAKVPAELLAETN